MKTHNIRNKQSLNPIVSFTPKFMEVLSEESEWTIRTVCAVLLNSLKQLTGETHVFDLGCTKQLEDLFRTNKVKGSEENYEIRRIFVNGLMNEPPTARSLEATLKIVQTFDDLTS